MDLHISLDRAVRSNTSSPETEDTNEVITDADQMHLLAMAIELENRNDYGGAIANYIQLFELNHPQVRQHFLFMLAVPAGASYAYDYFILQNKCESTGAQLCLGFMYLNGLGVNRDAVRAHQYFMQAAKQDNAIAFTYLGLMYCYGVGVEQNVEQGLYFLDEACGQENTEAFRHLGMVYLDGPEAIRNVAKAHKCLEKTVNLGDAIAAVKYGEIILQGIYSTESIGKAVGHFKYAAAGENVMGLCYLSVLHLKGLGVDQDIECAHRLMDLAIKIANEHMERHVFSKDGFPCPELDYASVYTSLFLAHGRGSDESLIKTIYAELIPFEQRELIRAFELDQNDDLNGAIAIYLKLFARIDQPAAVTEQFRLMLLRDGRVDYICDYCTQLDPVESPGVWLCWALALLQRNGDGDFDEACICIKKAVEHGCFVALCMTISVGTNKGYWESYDYIQALIKLEEKLGPVMNAELMAMDNHTIKEIRQCFAMNVESIEDHGEAIKNLGVSYLNKNNVAAYIFLRLAEDRGNSEALLHLGSMYLNGMIGFRDVNIALTYFEGVGKRGKPEGYYRLGEMYRDGNGVKRDRAQALHYFNLALQNGYAQAFTAVGEIQLNGWVGEVDYAQALLNFKAARDLGDTEAAVHLGKMHLYGLGVPLDLEQARHYFFNNTKYGFIELGKISLLDVDVEQRSFKASGYFFTAAHQGNPDGLCYIGLMHFNGIGYPRNYTQAFNLINQSANKGSVIGARSLGIMYSGGFVVPKDYSLAHRWFSYAANRGDAESQNRLGVMYRLGHGVPVDNVIARYYFEQAANAGDVQALINLGDMSLYGIDGKLDATQAGMYYQLAEKYRVLQEVRKLPTPMLVPNLEHISLDQNRREQMEDLRFDLAG